MEWWLRELESASIGCSPIKNLQEVFEDPQVKAPLGLRQSYISLSERSSGRLHSPLFAGIQGGRW